MKNLLSLYTLVLGILFYIFPNIIYAQKADDLIKHRFYQFQYNGKSFVAINIEIANGWHIYWKNPGDSGIATEWNWQNKPGINIQMQEWPTPTLFKEAGELWTFGYKDSPTFFAELISQQPNSKNVSTISLTSSYLICKEICLPAKFNFSFEYKNGNINFTKDQILDFNENTIQNLLTKLPVKHEIPSNFSWNLFRLENSSKLRLIIKVPEFYNLQINSHLLTPFPSQPLNFRHFSVVGSNFVQEIDWDGQYMEPPIDLPIDGIFLKPYIVDALIKVNENDIRSVQLQFSKFQTISESQWNQLIQSQIKSPISQHENTSLFLMIIFAFIGGLILNLMPCVLPVISIKLYGLIQHSNKSSQEIIKHHGSYTLGVVSSFWALAIFIATLKKSGESIGWGFQLQSPTFVWFLILLFFFLSLNLFGLFEFKTPAGNFISKIRSKNPYWDDFFSGLLAVIVATPCSAPFLGSALTYAFSESMIKIFLIFTFMGIGLSFPFIVTAVFPRSLSLLPRPGKWMEQFKYLMGFALLISVIWLMEVLQHLGNFSLVSFSLYFTLILCFFSLFIYEHSGKITPLVIFFFSFSLFNVYRTFPLLKNQFVDDQYKTSQTVQWIPWNLQEINKLLKEEKLFFVDATAKWCITCQVNKKLVMETQGFNDLLKKYNVVPIRLDWTKKDPEMFRWMQDNGAVSVPAYFVGFKGKIYFIGETLTLTKVENAFKNLSSN